MINHLTYTDKELTAWLVGEKTYWVQTRVSNYAKELAKLDNSRLVAHGVAGGFLKTYELSNIDKKGLNSILGNIRGKTLQHS